MNQMTFPRNRWLDVKMCADGLGVHVLKWSLRIQARWSKPQYGLGLMLNTQWFDTLTLYLVFWSVSVEPMANYVDWPWRRTK